MVDIGDLVEAAGELVPDVLTGQSPAQQRIAQGFRDEGILGGIGNAVGELPALAGDVGSAAVDFTGAGDARWGFAGATGFDPFSGETLSGGARAAALAGIVGIGGAAGLRAYHNVRSGRTSVRGVLGSEAGNVGFAGPDDMLPSFRPPPRDVRRWETPEMRAPALHPVTTDLLTAKTHDAIASVINDFDPAQPQRAKVHAAALAGFSQHVGQRLVNEVELHREAAGLYDDMFDDPSVPAAAHELSKFDALVRSGLLTGDAGRALAAQWNRLKRAPAANVPGSSGLADAIVMFARDTQHVATSDLWIPPPLRWAGFEPTPNGFRTWIAWDGNLLPTRVNDTHDWVVRVRAFDYENALPLLTHNIINAYETQTTPEHRKAGPQWYREANQLATEDVAWVRDNLGIDISLAKAAAIYSSFSPRTAWKPNNTTIAREFIRSGGTLETLPGHSTLAENYTRARAVWAAEDPHETLTALKTHNFARNIEDPEESLATTIDTHAFNAMMGHRVGTKKPPVFDASKKGRGSYQAGVLAHNIAKDILGIERANELQAVTWQPAQELAQAKITDWVWDDAAQRMLAGQADRPLAAVLGDAVGTPVTSLVPGGVVPSSKGENRGLLIAVEPDGGVAVYGEPTQEVFEALRGFSPLAVEVGGPVRWVPTVPVVVKDAVEHGDALLGETVRAGIPQFGSYAVHADPMGATHPTSLRGNHLTVEVPADDLAVLYALDAELTRAGADISQKTEHPTFTRSEPERSTRPVDFDEIKTLGRDGLKGRDGLLRHHQWALLTAQKKGMTRQEIAAVNTQLADDIRALGYHPVAVKGHYGEPESSFFVPGLPNSHAARLGRKYRQESVATPLGLIYTNRSHKLEPATGTITFDDFAAKDFYTDIPVEDMRPEWDDLDLDPKVEQGKVVRVQVDYDFNNPQTWQGYEDLDAPLIATPEQRVAYSYHLRDDAMPAEIKAYWDAVARLRAQDFRLHPTLYLQGSMGAPTDATSIYEHLYSDGVQTMVYRGRDGETTSPNASAAWVPTSDAFRYETAQNRRLRDKRTPTAQMSSGLMGDAVYDGEVRVAVAHLGPDARLDKKNIIRARIKGKPVRHFAVYVGSYADMPAVAHHPDAPELAAQELVTRFGADPTLIVLGEVSEGLVVDLRSPTHPTTGLPDVETGVRAVRTLLRGGVPVRTSVLEESVQRQQREATA